MWVLLKSFIDGLNLEKYSQKIVFKSPTLELRTFSSKLKIWFAEFRNYFSGPKGEPGIPGDAIKGQKGEAGNDGAPGLSGLPGIKGERGRLCLIYLCLAPNFWDLGKLCRPSSEATKHGIWSGSTKNCLHTGIPMRNKLERKKYSRHPLNWKCTQPIIRHIWVNHNG